MGNIVGYVEQCSETFAQRRLNEVDSLVFSCLAYLRFPARLAAIRGPEGVRLRDLAQEEVVGPMFAGVRNPDNAMALVRAVAASPRFADVVAFDFEDKFDADAQKQFSALTFKLGPDLYLAAFRGTDNTAVGWKEDFNMAFQTPVPAQYEAVSYLECLAATVGGRLICAGHSKGGNLAVYAASCCDPRVQARVVAAYSNDGPGFTCETLKAPGFEAVRDRVLKTVPQTSVIGLLPQSHEPYRVVVSERNGIWQHDPYSWRVEGCDFVSAKGLDVPSEFVECTLDGWLLLMAPHEREIFVEALYDAVLALCPSGGASEFWDKLSHDPIGVMRALGEASSESNRGVLEDAFGNLAGHAVRSAAAMVRNGAADALGDALAGFLRRNGRNFRL